MTATQEQQQRWARRPSASGETTLLLVRHGETTWNAEGRVQGHGDSSLSQRGIEQSIRVARRLAAVKIDAVYASDMSRALEAARLIAGPHKLEVKVRPELRERCYGVLEGKTLEECGRTQGPWFLGWQADPRTAPPAGESQDQMCERFMEALRDIMTAHPGRTVAVAGHGGPIKAAVYEILRIPTSLWRLTWIANGSITILVGTPDAMRVATLNDTCHLEETATRREEVEG
jgi:broad specificity phosphatase PhoE